MHKYETCLFILCLSLRVCESGSGGLVGGLERIRGCWRVSACWMERKGNSVGSAGLWHADVWLCRTKTLPNPAVWVLTLTESLLLHVRTNGAFRESQPRRRERPCPSPNLLQILLSTFHYMIICYFLTLTVLSFTFFKTQHIPLPLDRNGFSFTVLCCELWQFKWNNTKLEWSLEIEMWRRAMSSWSSLSGGGDVNQLGRPARVHSWVTAVTVPLCVGRLRLCFLWHHHWETDRDLSKISSSDPYVHHHVDCDILSAPLCAKQNNNICVHVHRPDQS